MATPFLPGRMRASLPAVAAAIAGTVLALASYGYVPPQQVVYRGFLPTPGSADGRAVRWAQPYARIDIGGARWRPVHARVEVRAHDRAPAEFRQASVTAEGVPVATVWLTARWQAVEYRGPARTLELRTETPVPDTPIAGIGSVEVRIAWSPLRVLTVAAAGAIAGLWLVSLARTRGRTGLPPAGVPRAPGAGLSPLNLILAASLAAFLLLLGTQRIVFGSSAGRWVYPYANAMVPLPFLAWLLLLPPLLALWRWTAARVERRPLAALAIWFVAGFFLNLAAHALAMTSLDAVIRSEANAFYDVARQYPPGRVLRDFAALSAGLPLHAGANMPGKIVLYQFLLLLTTSPRLLGYLIVALSNVPAVLLFLVLARMGVERRTALLGVVLAMIFPAKIALLPILNTVSPVFVLLALFLLVAYLRGGHAVRLWLMGGVLYATLFVEPVTLALGVVFVFVITSHALARGLAAGRLARAVAYPALAFLLVHAAVARGLDFDILATFRAQAAAAAHFNQQAGREYGTWVVANLPEFFIGAGVVPSLLLLAGAGLFLGRGFVAPSRVATAIRRSPGTAVLLGTCATVATLDLLGVNRGDVTRLWLFLAVTLQGGAAIASKDLEGASAELVLAGTLLQAIVTTSMVMFVGP